MNETMQNLLEAFNECPRIVDQATVPQNFNPEKIEHRKQVVVNFCCSYDKIYRLEKLLEELNKTNQQADKE